MRFAIGFILLAVSLPAPTWAKDSLGIFESWGAFRDLANGRCYAIAMPIRTSSNKDSAASASVANWPTRNIRGQIYFRLSREIKSNAPVILSVGERRFTLRATKSDAWAWDSRDDAAIVAAMRYVSAMSVQATDNNSRPFADTYALRGAATAIDAAAMGCARLR